MFRFFKNNQYYDVDIDDIPDETLGDKITENTENYVDERLGAMTGKMPDLRSANSGPANTQYKL